jgi:para-nitrobenzyl esterase
MARYSYSRGLRIAKRLPYIRSYVARDGHLFLSLMADGGTYEFEFEPIR